MSGRAGSKYPHVIDADARLPLLGVAEVWRYRGLVRLFAARDVKLRFRQTRFGALWLVVNPLFFSVGYAFLFGSIGRVAVAGHNYFVYTYVGISLWSAFSAVFSRTCNCLLANRELLTQAYFPRLSVPLAAALATQADVVISWAILLVCLLVSGERLSVGLLLLPVWFAVVQLMAFALGLIVASWTIAWRDLQSIAALVLATGPIFTAVAYPPSALPSSFHWLATINPLTPLFNGVRASAFGGAFPGLPALAFSLGATLILMLTATVIFGRVERRLADVI